MRTLTAALAFASSLVVTPAVAQQQPPPEERAPPPPPPATQPAQQQDKPSSPTQETIPLAPGKPAQQHPLVSTQAIVGAAVKNTAGEELGQIQELMIDPQSGQVRYAVLSAGSVMGMGGERYSIPWETLKMGLGTDELVVELDKAQLQKSAGGSPGAP